MKQRLPLVLLLLTITAAAWWWWPQPVLPPAAPVAGAAQGRAAAAAGAPNQAETGSVETPAREAGSAATNHAGPAASAPAAASYSLPPADLPLRQSATALLAAHRAGYVPATKRLFQELSDCQRHRWASLRMDMMIAFQDSPRGQRESGAALQEAMSKAAQTVSELAEHCADLPDDLNEALLFEVQRRAAEGGDLAGQLAFALYPAMSLPKALQQLDRVTTYKELAPQFLQRALEQGSGQAVAAFMDNYEYFFEGWRGPSSEGGAMQVQAMRKMMQNFRPLNPLQQVLGEDLTKAYSYAVLCKRVCSGRDVARAQAALDRLSTVVKLEDRRKAEDQAGVLYDAYFGARPRPAEVDLDALSNAVHGFRRG